MSSSFDRRQFLVASAAAGIALWTSDAEAGKSKAKRYRFATPGSDIDTGASVILVDAPLEEVLDVVQNYRKYREIMPKVKQSRIVGKKRGKTDVYMRVPIMKGAHSVWGVARFDAPKRHQKNGRIVRAEMVKGNVEDWHGAWKLEPKGKNQTVLRMEMFCDLEIPVPAKWVTPKLMWATDKSVTRVRDMVEKKRKG